jgi:hypothetical protein
MKDEALKLALEKVANALPAYIEGTPAREYLAVIHSALAAPVQEPVAWNTGVPSLYPEMKDGETISVEYTTPPEAQRQPLTEEEIMQRWEGVIKYAPGEVRLKDFARAIEAAHGITGDKT